MEKKIKVLHIQETVHSGGVERRRALLAKYLDKSIYEQKLICTFAIGPIVSELEQEGVEVIAIGKFHGLFDFRQYKKVIKIIKEYRPHIVHGAVFEGVTMACVCGFLTRVPIIIAEETSDPQNRSKRADFLLRLLSSVADKVVAISLGTEEYLRKRAKIKASKIKLINNGVELARDIHIDEILKVKAELRIQEGDFIIGSVGRLSNDHKRFTDIIEAVSLLKKDQIKILIIGEGRDKELIVQKAKDFQLEDQLLMLGYQKNTSLYYRLMDVFCLASAWEGFGLVAAEAMMHKLPVIVTKVGGLKYVVDDEETGFLVPPSDPKAIAEKLDVLIKNADIRKKIGEAGYHKAMREYSSKVYVENVDKMYYELIHTIN